MAPGYLSLFKHRQVTHYPETCSGGRAGTTFGYAGGWELGTRFARLPSVPPSFAKRGKRRWGTRVGQRNIEMWATGAVL
jgi:hypothetical protein